MNYIVLLLVVLASLSLKAQEAFDSYERKVEIPEPLFIDLVRNLSSEPGEWEINSLFYHSQGNYDELSWAPEIEMVLFDGTSIEFEFPMVGDKLYSYKFAVQRRIYQSPNRDHLHGMQAIYETDTAFNHSEATLFYIVAHRFNGKVSAIGLYGARSLLERYQGTEFLFNQSFFYNSSQVLDLGLELNYSSGDLSERYWQVIPQLHLAFEGGIKIQTGFGAKSHDHGVSPVGTFRLIQEFN